MDQQSKDYLRKVGIGPEFFSSVETLQLPNHSLLNGVTLCELSKYMPQGQARYIYEKINPCEPLAQKVVRWLEECGIGNKYHVYFQRLRLPSVEMIHHVRTHHLLAIGMETWEADIVVKMIEERKRNRTVIIESGDEVSEKEDVSEKKVLKATKRKKTAKKRGSPAKKTKKNSPKPGLFKGFLNGKKLHLGTITKNKFKQLHRKYNLKRQRLGDDKWTYCYTVKGEVKQVQFGLKHVLNILWEIERHEENQISAVTSVKAVSAVPSVSTVSADPAVPSVSTVSAFPTVSTELK